MSAFKDIYEAIDKEGFALSTLQLIENLVNDILNGTANFPRYTIPEHAGLCTAGPALIGASIIASYARASLTAGGNAECGQSSPSNWQIDELQEQLIERWAKASLLWVEKSEEILTSAFGPMIAQGAEAKVYYRAGDTSVVKERASIYSTTQKALDAIALHNYLFPETAMHVVGFTLIMMACFALFSLNRMSVVFALLPKKKLMNWLFQKDSVTIAWDKVSITFPAVSPWKTCIRQMSLLTKYVHYPSALIAL